MQLEKHTSCNLTWSLETSFEGLESCRETWDQAVERLAGNIYMTYDWLRTWWEFYGEGKQLRLFLFSNGDEHVAMLPIYLEKFTIGPLRTTIARLVGAYLPPKVFAPPVDPVFARDVFHQAVRHLFVEDRCDLLSFGPVSVSWPCNSALSEVCDTPELVGRATHVTRDVQTWFRLPATFEAYLETLSGTERKNRMKRTRHLQKSHQVSSDIVSEPTLVEREFEAFVCQHTRQWQAVNKAGHFGAWPNGEAYNRALVKAHARKGRVCFFRMLVDGQVVSSRYAFILGTTVYSELPAREVGEPWDKLGIGGISLVKFIESAIQSGVAAVDSGLGAYEHKTQLGGEQIPAETWRLTGRGVSAWRAWIFCAIAKVVFFGCHKIWYRRILPNLPPRFKRTQSLWWLRFDV